LNPRHRLIERLAASVGEAGASEQLAEFAWLLLDQARIVEGEQLPDPSAFARRLALLIGARPARRGLTSRSVRIDQRIAGRDEPEPRVARLLVSREDCVCAGGTTGCADPLPVPR